MADSRINVILGAKDNASKTVKGLRGQFELFKRDAIAGFGLGAGIGVFTLATRAIAGVTGAIGDSVKAAQDEEASMERLYAALRANADGWDGNTESVEDWLTANQRATGFADDEQRAALVSLVGATKDLSQAQDTLNLAMDLARARNIDLTTAADLLARVYAGNLGTLSRYGIIIEKGATTTEALVAIQKLAAGQARAYGNSSKGAADKSKAAWGDASEAIGARLTGLQQDFDNFSRGVAEGVIGLTEHLDNLGRLLDPQRAEMEDVIKLAKEEAAALGIAGDAIERYVKDRYAQAAAAKEAARQEEQLAGAVEELRAGLFDAGMSQDDVNRAVAEYERVMKGGEVATVRAVDEIDQWRSKAAQMLDDFGLLSDEAKAAYDVLDPSTGSSSGPDPVDYAKSLEDAISHVADTAFPDLRDAADDARQAIRKAFESQFKPIRALQREEERLARQRRKAMRQNRFDIVALIDQRQAEVKQQIDARRTVNKHFRAEKAEQEQRRKDLNKLREKFGLTKQQAIALYREASKDITVAIETAEARRRLDDLHARIAALGRTTTLTVSVAGGASGGGTGLHNKKHSGGYIRPHDTAIIRQDEAYLSAGSGGGQVVPLGSGGPIHTHVYLNGREIATAVDEQLGRRAATQGRYSNYRTAPV